MTLVVWALLAVAAPASWRLSRRVDWADPRRNGALIVVTACVAVLSTLFMVLYFLDGVRHYGQDSSGIGLGLLLIPFAMASSAAVELLVRRRRRTRAGKTAE